MSAQTRAAAYLHTQKAPLWLLLYGGAVACIVLAWILPPPADSPGLIILLASALLLALASSACHDLTVADEGDCLAIRFGPLPLFRRRVRYDDIEQVEKGRSVFLDGWGIHYSVRGGWVWNIWGRDCVVVHLTGGRVLRIGTDDAENLISFLQANTAKE
jgi:hypothetical protein